MARHDKGAKHPAKHPTISTNMGLGVLARTLVPDALAFIALVAVIVGIRSTTFTSRFFVERDPALSFPLSTETVSSTALGELSTKNPLGCASLHAVPQGSTRLDVRFSDV